MDSFRRPGPKIDADQRRRPGFRTPCLLSRLV